MTYKWYWMNDSGWTPFDAKKSADLEKGYVAKAKSVTLDKERFVDFSLSWTEICKNFTNLTDKSMVGIQRRFDDHNRRRAVKREKDSTSFFEDLQFACLSQLQGVTMKAKDKDTFNNVKTYGGKVVTSLSKSVDYLVVLGPTPPDASAETMTAESLKIPIVYASFITKCILDGQLVDHTSSIVPVKAKKVDDEDEEEEEKTKKKKAAKKKTKGEDEEMEGEDEEAPKKKKATKKKDEEGEDEEAPKKKKTTKKKDEEGEDEKPKKKGKDDKKRKAESDDEEEKEEPKKKTKVDKTDTKATNGGITSPPPPTTSTTTTTTTTTTTNSGGSSVNGLETLQPGTDWMGVCTDDSSSSHFPFLLQVLKIENSTFEGFIFWKTLNDAQTKIRGKFAPNGNGGDLDIDIEEYEAIKGEEELELPMTYSGVLSGKSISGRVGDKSSKSTFKLDLIKTIPFEVRVPTTWNGSCKSDTPFVLNVDTRTDDELTGTIEWQTTPVTVTKWRGTVSGLMLTVEEHEVVKGDEEALLRTWKLAVTQDETLSVKTPDNETFTVTL